MPASRISFAAPALDLPALGFESPLLHVEPDECQREERTRALETAGFPVLSAGSPSEALSLASAVQPRLILICHHDAAAAIELLGAFRRERLAPTSFIVLGAPFQDPALRADALEMGADACLAEPASMAELVAMVRARLRSDVQERERRLAHHRTLVQHQIAMIVAAVDDPEAARTSIVQTLCTGFRWKVGELWVPSPGGDALCYGGGWCEAGDELADFTEASRKFEFPPQEGLPWLVGTRREPIWVPDVSSHPLFHRADLTRRFGLRSALAAPLPLPSGRTAALVLFSAHSAHPDQATLDAIRQVSGQLATLIEPREAGAGARTEGNGANASEVLREKDEMLATVAHELRQPLTALQAAAWLLRARADADHTPPSQALDVLCRQSVRLGHIVGDLLDTARHRQGKLTISPSSVRLDELARGVVEDVRPEFAGSDLRLYFAAEALTVWADEGRLQQVLWNLLDNARKFTPAGGWVQVAVTREGEDAVLRVRDSGHGISPETLPLIFEMFRRGDNGRAPGLGIGLSLVRALVTMHGGSVAAQSEGRHRGSEFIVRLPASNAGGG